MKTQSSLLIFRKPLSFFLVIGIVGTVFLCSCLGIALVLSPAQPSPKTGLVSNTSPTQQPTATAIWTSTAIAEPSQVLSPKSTDTLSPSKSATLVAQPFGILTVSANVRSCPSTECPVVTTLSASDRITITAKSTDRLWWKYERGWVFGQLLNVVGDTTNIPTLAIDVPPVRAIIVATATSTPVIIYNPQPTTTGVRVGAVCNDGTRSGATGSGACSHHGGVAYWLYR